ncbi:MAG: hypothetical protein ACREJY_04585 [Candidatus Rokuibacteriota bacterium]
MEDRRTWKAATDLWLEAYGHQMEGELDRAIELYRRSIEVYPTPEAHTFLGELPARTGLGSATPSSRGRDRA